MKCLETLGSFLIVVVIFFPSTLNVVLTLQNHHERLPVLKYLCSLGRDNLRRWKSKRASHERKDLNGWARAGVWPWRWQGWLSPVPCAGAFITRRGSRSWSAASQGSLQRTTALWTSRSTTEEVFNFSFALLNLYLCWTCSVSRPATEMQTWQCAGLKRKAQGRQQGWLYFACYINLFRVFPSEGLGRCTRLH